MSNRSTAASIAAIGLAIVPAAGGAFAPPAAVALEHQWRQGEPPWYGGKTDRLVCVLSGVAGKFMGAGESVSVNVVNGVWRIEGSSNQKDVSGWMTCKPFAAFRLPTNKGSAHRYLTSQQFVSRVSRPDRGCSFTWRRETWGGEAMTFISSITGALRGNGEWVRVDHSNHPDGPSSIQASMCSTSLGWGAHSVFMGIPFSSQPLRFRGPKGLGSAEQAGEYSSTLGADVRLPDASDAMCYLTRISGTFNGGGEQVRIFASGNKQFLRTRFGSGQGVFANARCVTYVQN